MSKDVLHSNRELIGAILVFTSIVALFAHDPEAAVVTVECVAQGRLAYHGEIPSGQISTTYAGHPYEGDSDNLIDWHVAVFGAWEPEVVSAMYDLVQLYRGNDGVVVDVGANVGTHSIHVAQVAKTVHAIEPWTSVADRLDKTLEQGNIRNVVVHRVGFAEKPGELEYIVPPDENLGKGTFSEDIADTTGFGDAPKVMLPLVVGDDYLAEQGVDRVDMIKVDIEGYEKMALIGLAEVMKRDEPIVLFELHTQNDEGFHSLDELRATFPAGYQFFDLFGPPLKIWRSSERMLTCGNPDGVYVIEAFHNNFDHGGGNVLALPEKLAGRLSELPARGHVH